MEKSSSGSLDRISTIRISELCKFCEFFLYHGRRLIPDALSANDPIGDQAGEVVGPGVAPSKMAAALCAKAKRPRMTGKPGVLQRRHAGVATACRLRKRDDVKANAFRIRKRELVPAFVLETVPLVRDAVEAPRAQPIAGRIAVRGSNAALRSRFDNVRQGDFRFG